MKAKFKVTLELPDGVSLAQMRTYLYDAITTYCKCLDPGDEDRPGDSLFDLDSNLVIVQVVKDG